LYLTSNLLVLPTFYSNGIKIPLDKAIYYRKRSLAYSELKALTVMPHKMFIFGKCFKLTLREKNGKRVCFVVPTNKEFYNKLNLRGFHKEVKKDHTFFERD